MAAAKEYVFEQGTDGLITCAPPSDTTDVKLIEFKREKEVIWIAGQNFKTSPTDNRFTAEYTYRIAARKYYIARNHFIALFIDFYNLLKYIFEIWRFFWF